VSSALMDAVRISLILAIMRFVTTKIDADVIAVVIGQQILHVGWRNWILWVGVRNWLQRAASPGQISFDPDVGRTATANYDRRITVQACIFTHFFSFGFE
jgi:hypothetical protein